MEQVGAPFEIYNFPQTTFVASFVGTLNTLSATLVDASQGHLRVNGSDVYTTQPISKGRNGETVKLALRPEQLRLSGTGSGENTLPGRVESISFLGSIVRINITVGETTLLLDEFNHPHLTLPAVGAPVTLYFPREACLVLS